MAVDELAMRHEITQALYSYWDEVRRGRVAPNRLEIEPQRLGAVLLDAFILERIDERTFKFRIAGTRVSARLGMDLRETNFLDRWTPGDGDMIRAHLAQTVEHGRVTLLTVEATAGDTAGREAQRPQTLEVLILPLVHAGVRIDRLLCAMVPIDAPEATPLRLHGMRVVAAEYLWPERTWQDRHGLHAPDRQVPLRPHVRMGRIVRHGRRQFRVYDGGLSQDQHD